MGHAQRVTARKYMEDSEEWAPARTQVLRVKVGSFLVGALMGVATVARTLTVKKTGETVGRIIQEQSTSLTIYSRSEEQPAFYHSYEYLRGHKLSVIRLDPEVAECMSRDGLRETLHPRQLPMLVKPKPWLSYDQGDYLYNPCTPKVHPKCRL
jgi:DNA-directed RNA polymerase